MKIIFLITSIMWISIPIVIYGTIVYRKIVEHIAVKKHGQHTFSFTCKWNDLLIENTFSIINAFIFFKIYLCL